MGLGIQRFYATALREHTFPSMSAETVWARARELVCQAARPRPFAFDVPIMLHARMLRRL